MPKSGKLKMLALLATGSNTTLTTEPLSWSQLSAYGSWLKAQDPYTIRTYFGYIVSDDVIDALIKKFAADPKNHDVLVAKVNGQWAGTIHIATHGKEVEFGVIVAKQFRKQGIANVMMDEAITWARNRFYTDLYMHYISWNKPIKNLCHKHGLVPRNMIGDAEAKLQLKPPTVVTFFKERMINAQRNWYGASHLERLSSL